MNTPQPLKQVILYADDDRDDITLVEEAFTSVNNIELITADNGEDALTYLKKLSLLDPNPCLIILDINMPKLNGKETLARIRQMDRFSKVPVVLFTTSCQSADKNFADKYNAGFVTKPTNQHQLKNITEQFIDYCTADTRKSLQRYQD